jgi:hypothetical protein
MTTALEGGEWSAARPGSTLPPGKTRYPLYRRLGGPQGRSGRARKISPPPGFDPRTVQPVSRSLYRLSQPAHRLIRIYAYLQLVFVTEKENSCLSYLWESGCLSVWHRICLEMSIVIQLEVYFQRYGKGCFETGIKKLRTCPFQWVIHFLT